MAINPLYLPADISLQDRQYLQDLTGQFSIPLSTIPVEQGIYLTWQEGKVVLVKSAEKSVVYADFVEGRLKHRTQHNSGELIVKACNLKQNKLIWDATAGLGRDAFVLASFGATVCLFEKHPIAGILLQDALNRAKLCAETDAIVSKMSFYFGTIDDYLVHNKNIVLPDVVYLDPMFPQRQKSSAVKKEMAFFQEAIGYDQHDAKLLDTARNIAQKRIVVKRPKLAPHLADLTPNFTYQGKNTRFDGYLPKQTTKNKEY